MKALRDDKTEDARSLSVLWWIGTVLLGVLSLTTGLMFSESLPSSAGIPHAQARDVAPPFGKPPSEVAQRDRRPPFAQMPIGALERWIARGSGRLAEDPSNVKLANEVLEAYLALAGKYGAVAEPNRQRSCYEEMLRVINSVPGDIRRDSPGVITVAPWVNEQLGKIDDAVAATLVVLDYELRQEQHYAIPYTLKHLGALYRRKGSLELSAKALQEAVERGGTDTGLFYELGKTYEALGQLECALSWYDKAIVHWPAQHARLFPSSLGTWVPKQDLAEVERQAYGEEDELKLYQSAYEECIRKKAGELLRTWPVWLEKPG